MLDTCPIWLRSELSLKPTFSIIWNVSEPTGIVIPNGENDSQVPVQQAFLHQQRLTILVILLHTTKTFKLVQTSSRHHLHIHIPPQYREIDISAVALVGGTADTGIDEVLTFAPLILTDNLYQL